MQNCIISVEISPNLEAAFQSCIPLVRSSGRPGLAVQGTEGLFEVRNCFVLVLAPRVKATHGLSGAIKRTEAACQGLPNETVGLGSGGARNTHDNPSRKRHPSKAWAAETASPKPPGVG